MPESRGVRVRADRGHDHRLDDLASARVLIRSARARSVPDADTAARLGPGWLEGCNAAAGEGEAGIEPWLRAEAASGRIDAGRLDAIREALGRAGDEPDEAPPPAEAAGPRPFSLGLIGSAEFASREFRRRWLVRGVVVAGQPCIVGGPRKALKTSTMVDLVVSLASGTRFLDAFDVPAPTKVLFISGESGDATIQETALRVCMARGVGLAALEGFAFWGFSLPKLSNAEHMAALAAAIRESGAEAVVIDPLYLCLLSGNAGLDASNLFDVGPLLAAVSSTCLEAGATPILVHHLRKNRDDPHSPPELEDLAFAGVQEFARQWVMLGRRSRYEPGTGRHELWLNVGGSSGHSGAYAVDVDEGVIDDDFGGREWRVAVVRASESKAVREAESIEAAAVRKVQAERAKDEARDAKLAADADAALAKLREIGPSTRRQWRDALGWSSERLGFAIARLSAGDRPRISEVEVTVKSGQHGGEKAVPGFRAGGLEEL